MSASGAAPPGPARPPSPPDPPAPLDPRRAAATPAHRTSSTDPLRIAVLAAGAGAGAIGITLCPGKHDHRWARDLATDLDVVARWGAVAVLSLLEEHEFERLGVRPLGEQVRARGIAWHHLPIVDVGVPDARFEAGWAAVGPALLDHLHAGQRVLVHCRGGLGRAGMIAACLLVDAGVPAGMAIAQVRRARSPDAIETAGQEQYVAAYERRRRERDPAP